MGKYKQWLHHQEIGRRLRDQINTLEQERARVQQMAPSRRTNLPETDNPIIAALLNYTQQGHALSDIDVIKAAMPDIGQGKDTSSDIRQPAPSAVTTPASKPAPAPITAPVAAPAADDAVVASLLARAEQMSTDPLEQMRELSRTVDEHPAGSPVSSSNGNGTSAANADSVNGWWQSQRAEDD